ncbi:MAG TPA: hypothetical protein PLE81_10590, partial [Brevundimonas sp.]|uniref:hypothetical protein n=1 Tax=Brevundimonas sp. TaxID=1871086 RepID=UPI002CFE1CC8
MIDRRHLMMTAAAGSALAVSGCGVLPSQPETVTPTVPPLAGSDPEVVAAANAIYDRAFQM